MNLHFITSISKEYWYDTARFCIPTWDLPGKITIYVEQREGNIEWLKELPFEYELLYAPDLVLDDLLDKTKISKFWGKSCAQIKAVRNREENERVIWIDADVEQIAPVDKNLFDFTFSEPLGMLNSGHPEDTWETGIVIFNQQYSKLSHVVKKYEQAWHDEEILYSLWKPYDACVLGYIAENREFYNLCTAKCKNVDALENSIFSPYFKHWINKTNKMLLKEKNESKNSNSISQDSSEP
jgi:hypothetical protein